MTLREGRVRPNYGKPSEFSMWQLKTQFSGTVIASETQVSGFDL